MIGIGIVYKVRLRARLDDILRGEIKASETMMAVETSNSKYHVLYST
jgi:hypothetical protein